MDTFNQTNFLKNYGYGKGPEYIESIRTEEFPQLKDACYLDHTGATLYAKSQIVKYATNLSQNLYGNPHSHNASSSLSTELIENTRHKVVKHLGANLDEYDVIFTSGSTGSLKLIADTFDWSEGGSYCFLTDNHTSVIGIREVAKQHGSQCKSITEEEMMSLTKTCEMSDVVQWDKTPNTPHFVEDGLSEVPLFGQEHPSLFAYPAMSNFSGKKYPQSWIKAVHNGALNFLLEKDEQPIKEELNKQLNSKSWFVLLDIASLASSSPFSLSSTKPDFACISFYKMFGFPTGLGALLVSKRGGKVLSQKQFYGGGTVQVTLTSVDFHVKRTGLVDSFEDGTINFLDAIALKYGFDTLEKLSTSMDLICGHTFALAQYTYYHMTSLRYEDGTPLCVIYTDTKFDDKNKQGPVIAFNLLRSDGEYYGYSEVEKLACLKNIHLRTGCFCNTGACQKYIGISAEGMLKNFEAGHVCGDSIDLIDGMPTGALRISFGYMSSLGDANHFIEFLVECFLSRTSSNTKVVKSEPFAHCFFPPVLTLESATLYYRGLSQDLDKGPLDPELRNGKSHVSFSRTSGQQTTSYENPVGNFDCLTRTSIKDTSCEAVEEFDVVASCYNNKASVDTGAVILKRICLYPVKSCGAFQVSEWALGPSGLLYDRSWVIVTDAGVSLTQKREPKMCLIKPKIDIPNGVLLLTCEGYPSATVPLKMDTLSSENEQIQKDTSATLVCPTRVCGDRIPCTDCGDYVGEWLTNVLGRPCRLLRQINESDRLMKERNGKDDTKYKLSLTNVSQFLLISYKSVHRLHQEIHPDSDGFISEEEMASFADQFRANFIVDTQYPFEEDNWEAVKLGNVKFEVTGKSVRCQMICINQGTGGKSPYPLRALSKLRGTKMEFGIYLAVKGDCQDSVIRASDGVEAITLSSG